MNQLVQGIIHQRRMALANTQEAQPGSPCGRVPDLLGARWRRAGGTGCKQQSLTCYGWCFTVSDLLLNSVAEDDAGNVVKMTDAQVGRHPAVGATRAKRVT